MEFDSEVFKRVAITIFLMVLFLSIFDLISPDASEYAKATLSAICAVSLHLMLGLIEEI